MSTATKTRLQQYHNLSKTEEREIIPLLVRELKKTTYDTPMTNGQIAKLLRKHGYNAAEPTIRKYIHHIRVEHKIPCLIASQWGYWVEHEAEYVDGYIDSLKSRVKNLQEVVKAIKVQRSNMKTK